jgi:UDP-N-acetylmuramyl pentapeptide phosphotransferase/UDP-N-acetylglucosamine-1-phosphate transferase
MPAVTKVEECTREETGVGAAIAAGSHLLKGNWALLVIAVLMTIRPNIESLVLMVIRGYFEKVDMKRYLITNTRQASPKRLE